jgi:hypothetical protein
MNTQARGEHYRLMIRAGGADVRTMMELPGRTGEHALPGNEGESVTRREHL